MIYKSICAPLLYKLDPESAHRTALNWASIAKNGLVAGVLKHCVFHQPSPEIHRTLFGLKIQSPILIAAGLDKNGDAFEALECTGVGGVELGTVTPLPQDGNPKPRMFRFPKDGALINRLGFPSIGLFRFVDQARKIKRRNSKVLLGVNIGKNKDTPVESCESDYAKCVDAVGEFADYITINVSSPNTPGLRGLQSPEMLSRVVRAVHDRNSHARPIAVKISPDCTPEQINEMVDCCISEKVRGIIATNTTVSRPEGFQSNETGGLSGRPLKVLASSTVKQVCDRVATNSSRDFLEVIGAGGVDSYTDVASLLDMGCCAVQLYTALVFEGPGLICRINKSLEKHNINQ